MSTKTIIYGYDGCGTCRKAKKWLTERGIEAEWRPVRERPPTVKELKTVLTAVGAIKKLFNTSSKDYREAGIKDQLASMTQQQAFALLRETGNLVKRPFVVRGDDGMVGFNEDAWEAFFA